MSKAKEKGNKVKVKYPEIRKILQKLYRIAYRSGKGIGEKGDSYDYSTAYEEIEPILDTTRKETLEEVEKLPSIYIGDHPIGIKGGQYIKRSDIVKLKTNK